MNACKLLGQQKKRDDPDILIIMWGVCRRATCLVRQEIWYYELSLPLLMLHIIE